MKIRELLEDLPGLEAIPLAPAPKIKAAISSLQKPQQPNANAAPQGQTTTRQPNANVAPQAPGKPVQPILVGSTINLPAGPAKQPTQYKATEINQSTGTTVLKDPKNPNKPGLAYPKDSLQDLLATQQP